MAYIDKSNVTNGNTIQATDITNIVDALDSTSATAIKILGEFAQGTGTIPTAGTKAFAQGRGTRATGSFSHSEGFGTDANGDYSHAEGFDSISSGTYSHAEGNTTQAIGEGSHAEGNNTKTGTQNAYYADSVSSGVITLSSSYSDVSAEFTADNLLYLYDTPFDGIYIRAYFPISQSYYAAPNTIVELYDTSVTTTTAYVGDINYGVPNWTGNQTIPGDYSHAEGESTFAINSYAHAEGSFTSAVGYVSHTEGNGTQALGGASHAEGELTQAIGDSSHAEGSFTQAKGYASHAEGYGAKASGSYSHAEGDNTIALGDYSHAEGRSAQANGLYSHAEGNNTIVLGDYSHAEGFYTQAIGHYSHAEGATTIASGSYSHAEGQATQAKGDYSHAEGRSTIALGLYSHTEGRDTIASGSYQTVVGQNNTHGDTTSLFIVGGGIQDTRKDAFKVTHSSSIAIPQTQSAAPSWTGVDGEIVPVTTTDGDTDSKYFLYMWMNGAWRSSSFA